MRLRDKALMEDGQITKATVKWWWAVAMRTHISEKQINRILNIWNRGAIPDFQKKNKSRKKQNWKLLKFMRRREEEGYKIPECFLLMLFLLKRKLK